MDFILIILILAFIDREKEYTLFGRWFQNSWMAKVKNKFLRNWLESKAVNKFKPLGGYTPAFMYDLYHNLKGWKVLTLSGWHVYYTGNWWYLLIDSVTWYLIQIIFEGSDKRKVNNGE